MSPSGKFENIKARAREMINKTIVWTVALLLLSVGLVAACAPRWANGQLDEVNVQLKWLHQAEFAGFYVAQEKGYYAEENIRATLLPGGLGVDSVARVTSGKADFGVAVPDELLVWRSRGQPIVAIATIYRYNPLVFIAMEDSGIKQPSDFIGQTAAVGASDGELQFVAMIKKLGLDISKVNIMPFDLHYADFYGGVADITYVYSTVGLVSMREQGHAVNLIWPDDYGVHMYSDTLFTTEAMIDENPDLVTRFLRATLRGWQQAVEDPEVAAAITQKYALAAYVEFQGEMMKSSVPFIHTGEDHIGWMSAEAWEEMHHLLLEQDLLAQPVDLQSVYTMEFLEKIYGGGGG
jgi:NitT/TauT family transport system substrate-binding protein